jgi:hypothetical protein
MRIRFKGLKVERFKGLRLNLKRVRNANGKMLIAKSL